MKLRYDEIEKHTTRKVRKSHHILEAWDIKNARKYIHRMIIKNARRCYEYEAVLKDGQNI